MKEATDAAYAEYAHHMSLIRKEGERIIDQARAEGRRIIVLAGRPYHVDPEVNHGIAGEQGISRQGVHDLIKRCDKILKDYEAKLHLVAKFMKIKEMAGELERLSDECIRTRDMALIDQIRRLSAEITSTL